MRYLLMAALAALLWACGDTFNTPVNPEYVKPTITVTWVEVGSDAGLRAACARAPESPQILGCAYISPAATTCTIYTHKNPPVDVLGHEFLHCTRGRWHP